ncbi:MAG: HAD hydrolase-like protein, partial [Gammaproteobacteria bacterium]
MTLQTPEMVLLDLEGTLVDTVPDLAYCIDRTMDTIGLPRHGEEKIRTWVGSGIENLVKRALVENVNGVQEQALFEKAFPVFLEIYRKNTCVRTCCYPGVREGIDYLKGKQIELGCITNKRMQFTESILKNLGLFD